MSRMSVLTSLRQIVSLDSGGAAAALPLCGACLDEVSAMLREGVSQDDVRVTSAAAALAYYKMKLSELSSLDGASSFKAGDVTVSRDLHGALNTARSLRDEAFAALAPLMRDERFHFGGVDV